MPRRLTLVVNSLAHGGAEHTMAFMANHWAATHQITLITLDSATSDQCQLDPRVRRIALGLVAHSRGPLHALWSNGRRLVRLRQAIGQSRPDQVISFTDRLNVMTIAACWGLPVKIIIAERTDPRHYEIGRYWSALRRKLYPHCSALVVQTESVRQFCLPLVGNKPVFVIPNAAAPPQQRVENSKDRPRRVIALGRLEPIKGFDLLIEAFALVAEKHAGWQLQILGDGPERDSLERQIARHGLSWRVELTGWVSNPQDFLQRADLFALTSRFEGFPNSLLEAMACGLPAVSFDCDSGPREIIRHEVDGLLIVPNDADQLAAALDCLMSDEAKRRQLGQRAKEVVERFSSQRFFARWENVLDSVERL